MILAGGLGTRLRPITEKIPKPMVAVSGQPFLTWQLRECLKQNYKNVLLLVSYLGEQIQSHYGDGSSIGLSISYSFEGRPLGTGGALKNAFHELDESFFVLNGDSFLRAPMSELERSFDESGADALISTYDNRLKTPVKENLKVVDGWITRYQKAGGTENGLEVIDSGIYLLKKSVISKITQEKFQLEDLWPDLIKRKKLFSVAVSERFYDIGTPERLTEFEEKIHDYFTNSLPH